MQQLIDKQVLLQALKKKRYSKQSLDLIESQPVVDAIPVEWIKKWEQKEENYYLYKDLTRKLIADWEKENEKDI